LIILKENLIFVNKKNNMLSEVKIKKNAAKFFESGEKYGALNANLIDALGTDIVEAPASTRIDLHNAFPGGLIDHILRVAKYCVSINEILPEPQRVNQNSLLKVAFIHQIGKVNLYKKLDSPWHNERGIMYEFNDKLVSMRVGERSVYLALRYGINLSEEEYVAIINFDKDGDDMQAKYHNSLIGDILKSASLLAIKEEKFIIANK